MYMTTSRQRCVSKTKYSAVVRYSLSTIICVAVKPMEKYRSCVFTYICIFKLALNGGD
jgi:hypothetical protein